MFFLLPDIVVLKGNLTNIRIFDPALHDRKELDRCMGVYRFNLYARNVKLFMKDLSYIRIYNI